MTLDQVRRRCQTLIVAIDLPVPFDVRALCARIAIERARPIHLLPASMPTRSLCGVWIATDAADYFFYEESTSAVHQEHIILHELGHLLCGHQCMEVSSRVDQATVSSVFQMPGRGARPPYSSMRYSRTEETEAELIASVLGGLHELGHSAKRSAPEADGPARRLWSCLVDER
jgi:hypothetical protein